MPSKSEEDLNFLTNEAGFSQTLEEFDGDADKMNKFQEEVNEASDHIGEELEVLEILKNILDANTLFRVFPYKIAKSFSDFIKTEEKVKEWLENEKNE